MIWFENDTSFTDTTPLPPAVYEASGPKGPALVSVFKEGKTTTGWGPATFMECYDSGKFRPDSRVLAAQQKQRPFALVMRSVSLIAVDIDRHLEDGGADGFVAARKLGLPATLAQTSRSGKGRHLLYAVDDSWDSQLGFARFDDAIAIAPGVDVRAVGCIYRHATQRWNSEEIAPAPESILELLQARKEKREVAAALLSYAASVPPDSVEALIIHDSLLSELAKPIPVGKRNSTLFAIGAKMYAAGVPGWEQALMDRAHEIGIDQNEAAQIVRNVTKYHP